MVTNNQSMGRQLTSSCVLGLIKQPFQGTVWQLTREPDLFTDENCTCSFWNLIPPRNNGQKEGLWQLLKAPLQQGNFLESLLQKGHFHFLLLLPQQIDHDSTIKSHKLLWFFAQKVLKMLCTTWFFKALRLQGHMYSKTQWIVRKSSQNLRKSRGNVSKYRK